MHAPEVLNKHSCEITLTVKFVQKIPLEGYRKHLVNGEGA